LSSTVPARKRGRPPLPLDNETRERILNAARKLFEERSFTQVSVREITEAAGVGVAAINYHFGNKEGLLRALTLRQVPEVIAERKQLLEEARQCQGSVEARIRAILSALVTPAIRWSTRPDAQANVLFWARMRLDGPAELRSLTATDTRHLKPFVRALQEALPELPATEVFWRLHFVLGIEHSLHQDIKRLQSLSGGLCDVVDADAMIERVLDFAVPGMLQSMPAARSGRRKAR
jgi:AcrR family transcriptional regulator